MPPQIPKAGDPVTNVNPQAPIKIEEPKTKELDMNAAQKPPNLDPKTAAKNYEAAKQHATDTKNQDSARVQILKNRLAQKLPEKKMPTTDAQNKPGTPTQQSKTLKDQLAEGIAKGTDGPKILVDNNIVHAGPTGGTQESIPSPRQPVNSGPPVSVKTAKGTESISAAEYERRYRAASDYVKREASVSLKPGEEGVERLATIRKQAAKTYGLPEDWSLAKNDPQVWKAKEIADAKFKGNSGRSSGQGKSGSVDPQANTQPRVDPHANTQPRVDPHATTQPRVDAYAKTEAGVAGKAAEAAEEGSVAGKAVGATEKAVSTGAKVVEGASTGVKVTSAAAKVGGAIAHMSPVLDGLMVELDYFTSYAKAHDIIRQRNTENGFAIGMAASLMGASPQNFGLNAIDRGVVTQVLGAEGIAEKSHNKGVYDGYKYAQSLSTDQRNRLREEAFKNLAAKGYHTTNPGSFDQMDVISTAGVMVPGVKKLFEEARKAAEAQELKNRKEKNPSYGSRF